MKIIAAIQEMKTTNTENSHIQKNYIALSGFEKNKNQSTPPAVLGYGAYASRDVLGMLDFINTGTYLDENFLIGTWITIDSGAQIGKNAWLGHRGLASFKASPVIVEDGAVVGSGCILKKALLDAPMFSFSSTEIMDITDENKAMRRFIPPHFLVISDSYTDSISGKNNAQYAFIINKRTKNTNLKASVYDALHEFEIII